MVAHLWKSRPEEITDLIITLLNVETGNIFDHFKGKTVVSRLKSIPLPHYEK